jgi:TctA family transporter
VADVTDVIVGTFLTLLSGWHLVYLLIGVYIGLIFGLLPALGSSAGMAILLPFVFGMDPTLALPMMIGMMAVTPTADTFPSVLIGIPGSNGSQATILDGFPMSKRGEGARALSAAFTSSLVGGLFGAVILTFAIFSAKPLLLTIGFGEQLMLILLALSMVGTLAGANAFKGLASCGLGLLFGMIGTAPFTGAQRLTFDSPYLLDGVPLVIVGLAIFALPEIIDLVRRQAAISQTGISLGEGWIQGVKDTFIHIGLVMRCSIIGVIVGALPGIGGSVVNWVSYSHAVQTARDKSQFGKGDVRGVLAPESANNSQDGGALIPTLLFGIPGSGSMALLLAGFILIGIEPGIKMVSTSLDLTYLIIWSLALGNIFGAGTCVLLSKPIAKLTTVPSTVIAPFMFVLIFFAAFQATRDWGDLLALMALGTFAVYLKRFGWPRPAFMIGFVLSTQLENGIYRVVQIYQFSFLQRPVVLAILALTVVSVFFALRVKLHNTDLSAEGVHSPRHRWPQIVFYLVVVAFNVVVLVESFNWQFATALFPRTMAAITLALLIPVGIGLFTYDKPSTVFYEGEREEFGPGIEQRSNEYYLGWLLATVGLAALIGFVPAFSIFVYAFLRLRAHYSHRQCIIHTAALFALLAGMSYMLSLQYPAGLLQEYVPLPWPLA